MPVMSGCRALSPHLWSKRKWKAERVASEAAAGVGGTGPENHKLIWQTLGERQIVPLPHL